MLPPPLPPLLPLLCFCPVALLCPPPAQPPCQNKRRVAGARNQSTSPWPPSSSVLFHSQRPLRAPLSSIASSRSLLELPLETWIDTVVYLYITCIVAVGARIEPPTSPPPAHPPACQPQPYQAALRTCTSYLLHPAIIASDQKPPPLLCCCYALLSCYPSPPPP